MRGSCINVNDTFLKIVLIFNLHNLRLSFSRSNKGQWTCLPPSNENHKHIVYNLFIQKALNHIILDFFPFFLFYCCSVTVVPITPLLLSSALPTPTSHIQSYPHPVVAVRGSFKRVLWRACPFIPRYPCPLPSGHCEFVLYFHVSGSVLLACFFCWLGSTYRWDHTFIIGRNMNYFKMYT